MTVPRSGFDYSEGEYWERNPTFHEEDAEYKAAPAVELLRRNGIRPDDLFEVGCSSGKTLSLLAGQLGCRAHGIDPSPPSIERANRLYANDRVSFSVCPLEEYEGVHDVGVMFDVFEHVEDYRGFLRKARPHAARWLFNIPLDMFALAVLVRFEAVWREQYGHLVSFSATSAVATLEECGYRVVDQRYLFSTMHSLKADFKLRRLALALPRLALQAISEDFAARSLGPASLLVLADARP